MVNFNKQTFLDAADSKVFTKAFDLSSIENSLKKYPAFNSAYLIQAYLLKQKSEEDFTKRLPYIAINVKDRAVLHDFIYKENIQAVEAKKTLTKAGEQEKEETQKEKIEETKLLSIEDKVLKKTENTEVKDSILKATEQEKIEVKENLPDEKEKEQKKQVLNEKPLEAAPSIEEEKPKEAIIKKEKQTASSIIKDLIKRQETKVQTLIEEENPKEHIVKKEKQTASSVIKDLIKRQEAKVQTLIEEENTFEEKNTHLEFIDWLKLKNTTAKKETEIKQVSEPISKIEKEEIIATEKEDLIPFERTSTIEAEMHEEVKASSDPLENFISSEIIRKKKKKTPQKNVIVSETLAEILTLQQKYIEALEVYELLSLKYPQKSIYFANQIEKIKTYL